MNPPSPFTRPYAAMAATCAALALAIQSCGVMASEDCAVKATCKEEGPTADDVGFSPMPDALGDETREVGTETAASDRTVEGASDHTVESTEGIAPDGPTTEETRDGTVNANDGEVGASEVGLESATNTFEAGDVLTDVSTEEAATEEAATPEAAPTSDGCIYEGPEVCTNGVDDDCNGLTDCADPACAAYTCAVAPPSGWSGPVAFWQAINPAPAPSCPPNYGNPRDANGGLNAPAANCGVCTCRASGQSCAAIATNIDSDTNCVTACPGVTVSSASCTDLPNCGGANFSMMLPVPAITGGSCIANSGSVTVPPATWSGSARLCSYVGPTDGPGGCPAAGDQCVLSPTANYGTTLCVYATTDPPPSSCPAPYNRSGPSVFYSGNTDTRGCAGCTCASGGPSGGSCSGTLTIFGASGCDAGATTSYTLGSGCNKTLGVSPRATSVLGNFTITDAGSCSVQTQPMPSGMATPTGPTTVCCM